MASSSNAIKAGRAFVELFADDNPLYRGLDRAGNRLRSWGAGLTRMGATLGAAGGGLFGPMLASLTEITRRSESLQLFSDRIGENVAGMSALAGGFERAGVSAEQFQGIIESLEIRINEAADSNGYLLENLRSLGPAARLAALPIRDVLDAIADKIQRIPKAINQLRAAQGAGLEAILPQLRRGRAGIDELFADGAAGGITTEQGRQSIEVMKAVRQVWNDFKDTVRSVGLSLLPTAAGIAELKEKVRGGMMAVRDWIKENRGAILTTAAIGAGLIAAGVVVTGFGLTVAIVGKGIVLTVVTVKAAFALLFSWVGLVGVGLVALATQTQAGRAAVSDMATGFAGLGATARASFGAIAAAAQRGDWAGAFRIGIAVAKAEWATFTAFLARGWWHFTEMFAGTWDRVIAGIKLALNEVGAFVLTNTVGRLREVIEGMVRVLRRIPGMRGTADQLARGARANLMSPEEIERQRRRNERGILGAVNLASEQRRGRMLDAALEASRARMEARRVAAAGGGGGGWMSGVMSAVAGTMARGLSAVQSPNPAPAFNGQTRLFDAVKGIGQGSAAQITQGMAFGDTIPQQQLDAMQGINTNTADIPQMARDLNTIASSGRLTR